MSEKRLSELSEEVLWDLEIYTAAMLKSMHCNHDCSEEAIFICYKVVKEIQEEIDKRLSSDFDKEV